MYEIVKGVFISLTVGLIIFTIQTISNKIKECFRILTYFKNISPIIYYNKRVIKHIEDIYKIYYINLKNKPINEKVNYNLLRNYLKTSQEDLMLLPEIADGVININFFDFFLDMDNLEKQEEKAQALLDNLVKENDNFLKENQIALGTYETLFCCIKSFNDKIHKLDKYLDDIYDIKQDNQQIRKLIQDVFVDFDFIKVNIDRFDSFIDNQSNITYSELKKVLKYNNCIKYTLIVLVILLGIVLIA